VTDKTIGNIRSEYTAKLVAAQHARDERIREITAMRQPSGDPYLLERVPAGERERILLEQKAELAEQNRNELRRDLERAHDAYKAAAEERTGSLRERLFAVEGGEKAELLARLATASQDELGSMLSVAAETGNKDLGRAVFATAHRRDIPELLVRYFAEIDPESQPLYQEFNASPSEETLARQREGIGQMIGPASPEQLAGTPPVYS
jgi:hypothetical protein